MSLFNCSKCGAVENTALANLGSEAQQRRDESGEGWYCSECHGGTWHGEFEKSFESVDDE